MGKIVLGDWGTSSLTLAHCEGDGTLIDNRSFLAGNGVKFCDDPEEHFHNLIASWGVTDSKIQAYLTGMVGSTIGWIETPYAACPLRLADIADSSAHFDSRGIGVTITAGARCINPFEDIDVMRGEEVQVLGALQSVRPDNIDKHLFCIPGTHTKWVQTEGQTIQNFMTMPRGELWEVLTRHSILLNGRDVNAEHMDWETFDSVLRDVTRGRWPSAFSAMFGVRAGMVSGEHNHDVAAARLSAILVGFDIKTGLSAYDDHDGSITIIGSKLNASLYERAFKIMGRKVDMVADQDAAFSGLIAIAKLRNGL